MRDVVKLRYRLLPYIYSAARQSYDTGVGMCRPMYYIYPELEEAYNNPGQYFFGNDIIVAPVTRPRNGEVASQEVWPARRLVVLPRPRTYIRGRQACDCRLYPRTDTFTSSARARSYHATAAK